MIEINRHFRSPVGAVSNRTGLECSINSKIYHKLVNVYLPMLELATLWIVSADGEASRPLTASKQKVPRHNMKRSLRSVAPVLFNRAYQVMEIDSLDEMKSMDI